MAPLRLRRVLEALALVAALAADGAAQDRPALFLHGLNAAGSDWAATASRLGDRLAIEPRTPDLSWREPYERQAELLSQSPALAGSATPVAIGHSNGGIVARQLSRVRRVDGIVTIGTPHHGAPILPRFGQWLTFQASTPAMLNSVLQAFGIWTDWSWAFAYISGALGWISDFSIWSVVYLGTSLGLQSGLPVTAQMMPGSAYLNGLNSWDNLNREATDVAARVGLVSVAHNFYWAGPARAIAPEQADAIAGALYSTAFGLFYWGSYILTSGDPTDIASMQQATSLLGLGGFLLAIDPYYCSMVSGMPIGICTPNDGVLPYTSQEYPGAPNIYLGLDNDGPAHSQEKEWGEPVLYDALTWYMHLSPRGATTPGPDLSPSPDPSPDPAPTPSPSGGGAPAPGSDPGLLLPDDVLNPGDRVDSSDGRFHFVYQQDGNLVLYDETWSPLWASHTDGSAPGFVVMQADGNFVMYDGGGSPIWASGRSYGHPGAYLLVQSDGNVVIYDVDQTPLWATDTWR